MHGMMLHMSMVDTRLPYCTLWVLMPSVRTLGLPQAANAPLLQHVLNSM
jgi:hypothetical protein